MGGKGRGGLKLLACSFKSTHPMPWGTNDLQDTSKEFLAPPPPRAFALFPCHSLSPDPKSPNRYTLQLRGRITLMLLRLLLTFVSCVLSVQICVAV